MSRDIGPSIERSAADVTDEFGQVVGGISDGMLVQEPPFDLATSAALASNDTSGKAAEGMLAAHQRRHPDRYTIKIFALAPGHPDLGEREIVDTVVDGPISAIAILIGVVEELQRVIDGNTNE